MNEILIDKLNLHQEIENFVQENDVDYIDAILHYCEVNDVEIETIGNLITKDLNLVSKIQLEAEELHFIKKVDKLPI